ncbi:MAG: AbfB domain-containing protein [Colwellia sp.]|nr:AbfB domain-containing protein [Colwellia sp.]
MSISFGSITNWLTRLFAVVLLLFITPSIALSQNFSTSLQSVNYPDRYIRHRGFMGYIEPITSALDQKDASFVIVPGLASTDHFSLHSVNYPGYYLRHQNYEIKLAQYDGSDLFRKDASFKIVGGLYGQGGFSLESVNFPGYYVRHQGYRLFIHRNDGSPLFMKDATFRMNRGFSQ